MATGALVGLSVIGTLSEIDAIEQEARSNERAALDIAALKRQEALDIFERFEINTDLLRRQEDVFKGEQLAAIAASGVDVGTGSSPLLALESTTRNIAQQIDLEKFETTQKTATLEKEALSAERAGRDFRSVGKAKKKSAFFRSVGQIGLIAGSS